MICRSPVEHKATTLQGTSGEEEKIRERERERDGTFFLQQHGSLVINGIQLVNSVALLPLSGSLCGIIYSIEGREDQCDSLGAIHWSERKKLHLEKKGRINPYGKEKTEEENPHFPMRLQCKL